jgi:hypothetical protein
MAAQREFEERKIIFLGNLVANIAFDDSITRPLANQLISISYRQMCIMSLFAQSANFCMRNKHILEKKI